jgi:Zn-dependent protease
MAVEPMLEATVTAASCPACGSQIAPRLLSCPSCQRLVHADRLKELAAAAQGAESQGEPARALPGWREALALLPPESRQYAAIAERIAQLGRQVEARPAPLAAKAAPTNNATASSGSPGWSGGMAGGILGTLALALWKFKFLAVFLLTKAKFLLLGLTKASTFLSMFLAFGVYWTAFGGPFALGLVLSIYIHEMGHVAALLRYGVAASAPLFVPGLGAFIRLNQAFSDPRQDARVGLAGPIWGMAAALVCAGVFALTRQPLWGALAHVGGLINLFNLLPIWQLDGGRAFRSLSRAQRWLALAGVATVWAITSEGLLVLLMLAGAARAALDKSESKPDAAILVQYIGLVAILSGLCLLSVPLPR